MSLRVKALLLVGSTLALILVVLQVVLERIVDKGFDRAEVDIARDFGRLEREEALRNVARAHDALNEELSHLAIKVADWAQWDDTWHYIVARNQAYERSNLVPATLRALQIEALAILDGKGKVAAAIAYDFGKDATAQVPEGLLDRVGRHPAIAKGLGESDFVTGIVPLPAGIFLVAARPVVRSDGSGPVHGTLFFARRLDGSLLRAVAATTHLDVALDRSTSRIPAPGPDSASKGVGDLAAWPLSETVYEGRILLRDLAGMPTATLRVRMPRGIHRQAEASLAAIRAQRAVTTRSVLGSVGATGALFAALLVAILEGAILARLSRLSRGSAEIGRTGDFAARLPVEGRDEIAVLSLSINAMLVRLAATNALVAERDAARQLVLDAVPTGLLTIDADGIVAPIYSRAALAMLGEPPEGREIGELLGLSETQRSFLREFLGLLRDRQLPGPESAALNPVDEIRRIRDGQARWLRLRFLPVDPATFDPRILVILEDVTVTRSLAAEVAASRQEKLEIMAIAGNPDGFRDFLDEIDRLLLGAGHGMLRALETGRFDPIEGLGALRERLAWIGGQARTFGDEPILAAGTRLMRLLEAAAKRPASQPEAAGEVRATLAELARAHVRAAQLARPLVLGGAGSDGDSTFSATDSRFPVEPSPTDPTVAADRQPPNAATGERRPGGPHPIPARRALAKATSAAAELGRRAGRSTSFRFEGGGALIDPALAQALEPSVRRLLDNAFQREIEPPEERRLAGKPEQGEVALSIWKGDRGLAITISDDGRGIDPEIIRSQAVEAGILLPGQAARLAREECFALLFRREFPSRKDRREEDGAEPTGFAAIAGDLRLIGGDVALDSAPGRGTRVTMWIPSSHGDRNALPAAEEGRKDGMSPLPGPGEKENDLVAAGDP